MSTTKKRSAKEAWDAIERSAIDDEMERILALDDAALAKELEAAGFDVDANTARAKEEREKLLARRDKLAKHLEAQALLARVQARFAAAEKISKPARPRHELLAGIERARKDPRLAQPVAILFRNKKTEEASDAELEAVLEELELLAEDER